ncbi:hypothetical protein Tco_0691047 [Tanacetum coccineum]
MIRGNTSKKRPREQSEQGLDNEISFPSTPRCQLVDSPIILEALIDGFLVRRIFVDEGSSSKVMYEHCFQNLRSKTKAKLKESRTPLVGFSGERMEEAQGSALEERITFPRTQAPDSEGTTSTGREESQGQTNKAGELRTPYNRHPSYLRKTLKQMKEMMERTNPLRGHSEASLLRKWSFITIIWTKPLQLEEIYPLNADLDL